MRQRCLIAMIAVVLGTTAAHAGFIEMGLNDETVDVRGGLHFGDNPESQFLLGGRYLYHDDDEGDAKLPGVFEGFSSRPSANNEIGFVAGIAGYFGEAEELDIEGVAVGGSLLWYPGGWKGFYVGGRLYWAPSILCTGDTDGILEWAGQGGYKINKVFRVFIEYTNIAFDTEEFEDIDVVEEFTFGFGFDF